MKTYELFSRYVIDTFLTHDKKDEFASLVIDEQFMENTANKIETSRDSLIKNLCSDLFTPYPDPIRSIDSIIAIVSLQLYAASKCESDGEYSANAYNPRLCEIINRDVSYLQAWYSKNQEKVWRSFYEWCTNNDFIVRECQPRFYKNRFIQYPLELAKYLLNREDLKYIASVFNRYKLQPYENIFYSDFWNIIDIRFDFRQLNNHIQKVFDSVFEDTGDYDIVKSQVYNHYIVWDGEYIEPYEARCKKAQRKELFQIHLSDKNDIYRIDIRKEDGSKITNFRIDSTFYQELGKYYSYKRDSIIIFQRDSDGDLNYWDETRFIGDKNESGLAIVSNNFQRSKFYGTTPVFYCKDIVIYEFKYNDHTKEFYSSGEQIFELIGGLRITRRIYLIEGEPILRIRKDCTYLMNGKTQSIVKGDHHLTLPEGEHSFKFPKSREFKITMVSSSNKSILWHEAFCKWEIKKKEKKWLPVPNVEGIIGLNFEPYSKPNASSPALKRWVKALKNEKIDFENNVSLKLLNNINRYE
ncbi:hypothetical protein [Dysgonomonas macrotermitis]|uniref:Uncharacterized protein n=1 Tax=Dysgonomonas macrotermitis TaxID=1346286 RepID=A0A1M5IKF7_9BACT|nr:hypothetical protein [Dysgonomonas macrotermitis]SHG28529.1 hypothetical protein SAMN05444362_12014 [Dysgonomonas macrotermitis]